MTVSITAEIHDLGTPVLKTEMLLLGANLNAAIYLPSADFGNEGRRSGMSSADRPSTLSTTDLGRSLRP
jgi:hypothetical protein